MATQAGFGSEVNRNLSTTTDAPEIFVPLNDLQPRGYLPWRKSQMVALVKARTLPEPAQFGPKLRGYVLTTNSRHPAPPPGGAVNIHQARPCLACGKRLQRWQRGRARRSDQTLCGDACRKARARLTAGGSPGKGVRDKAKEVPNPRAFLEPVCATDHPSEYGACTACGRACRIQVGEPTFCNERCRTYEPRTLRRPNRNTTYAAAPLNLVGGGSHRWPGATKLDPELRAAILHAEIGGVPKTAPRTAPTKGA